MFENGFSKVILLYVSCLILSACDGLMTDNGVNHPSQSAPSDVPQISIEKNANNELVINWQINKNANTYILYLSKSADFSSSDTREISISHPPFTVSDLENNHIYYAEIRSAWFNKIGLASNKLEFKTPPVKPSNLKIENETAAAPTLQWDGEASYYNVYWSSEKNLTIESAEFSQKNVTEKFYIPDLSSFDSGKTIYFIITGSIDDNESAISSSIPIIVPSDKSRINQAPIYQSAEVFNVNENQSDVATLLAQDSNDLPLDFKIVDGNDAGVFKINSGTGLLQFIELPDYESPQDFDVNNNYQVTIQISNGISSLQKDISITVLDVQENLPEINFSQSLVAVAENVGAFDVTLSLDIASSNDTSVLLNTIPNTASNDDFTTINSLLLTIPSGSIEVNFELTINNDNLAEGSEHEIFSVELSQASGLEIGLQNSIQIDIVDDDPFLTSGPNILSTIPANNATGLNPTTSSIDILFDKSLLTSTINEATVKLSDELNDIATTVNYVSSNNSIQILPKTNLLASNTYQVSLGTEIMDVNNEALAQAFIFEFQTRQPILTYSVSTAVESENAIVITFSLDAPSSQSASFDYVTQNDSAILNEDYLSLPGSIIFSPGEVEKNISIELINDDIYESDEQFTIILNNDNGLIINQREINVVITDDEITPEVRFLINDINENISELVITAQLDRVSGLPIKFNYQAEDDTATSPDDFENKQGEIVFNIGEVSKQFSVNIVDDDISENSEQFFLTFTNPLNATLSTEKQSVTIFDNDNVLPNLSVSNTLVDEFNSVIEVELQLSRTHSEDVSVDFTTVNNTATQSADFTFQSNTTTIRAGDLTQLITIPILNDNHYEGDETFYLQFSNALNALISVPQVTLTIRDDELIPNINVTNIVVDESENAAIVTVNLAPTSVFPITVNYSTGNATAIENEDFVGNSGLITFNPGQSSKTVSIVVNDDVFFEKDEVLFFNLFDQTNAVLVNDQASITILNNDPLPVVNVTDITIQESIDLASLKITLDKPSNVPVNVSYSTADISAIEESDYIGINSNITFSPGETEQTIFIPILDDTIDENEEEFFLNLGSPVNAIVNKNQVKIKITDNDFPSFIVDDISINEGDGIATLTVSLSSQSNVGVSVNYYTSNNDAIAPSDFLENTGTLMFEPGVTTANIQLSIIDDSLDEIDETFFVLLKDATNAIILNQQAVLTIIDNDGLPSISTGDITVDENGDNATLSLSLTNPSSQSVSVNYSTASGSAVLGEDFVNSSGTLVFPVGETNKSISIPIKDDDVYESDETFTLNLSGETNALLSVVQATVTIVENEPYPILTVADVVADESANNVFVSIALDPVSTQPITTNYSTNNGTAIAIEDYTSASGNLLFNPGQNSKTISIAINDDLLYENDELFDFVLSNANNANFGKSSANITISNNDSVPTLSLNDVTVDESIGSINLTATLNTLSGLPVVVDYNTSDISALQISDYVPKNGQLVIQPGDLEENISVTIIDDNSNETNESFSMDLLNPINVSLNRSQTLITITDNDLPTISSSDLSVNEAAGVANVSLLLSDSSDVVVTVSYSTVDDSAVVASDYTLSSGVITFSPGELSKTISVPISDDNVDEIDEKFIVTFSDVSNATLQTSKIITTIIDNDGLPSVNINNVAVDESIVNATVILTLSSTSEKTVNVIYSATNDTAIQGQDFTNVNGSLAFLPGETSKSIVIPIVDDNIYEGDEQFIIRFSSVENALLNSSQVVITINENEAFPSLNVSDVTVDENSNSAIMSVTLSPITVNSVTVNYDTSNGSAIVPADYTSNAGTITFNPGQTTKTVSVAIIEDEVDENDEQFFFQLSTANNAVLSRDQAVVKIVDNDFPPSLSVSDMSVDESAGTVNLALVLNKISALPITVNYDTVNNSAIQPLDYLSTSGVVTFAPGEISSAIPIVIIDDNFDEPDETFHLNLSDGSNVTLNKSQVSINIADNDFPSLNVEDVSINEFEPSVLLNITLSAMSNQTVTVDFATSNNSATATEDYGVVTGSVSFAPGETTKTILIPIVNDDLDELDEYFSVNYTNVSNAILSASSSQITIVDNDGQPSINVSDVTIDEGGVNASVIVTLSSPSGLDVNVNYATANGSANFGQDYTALSDTLVFTSGQTSQAILIPIVDDAIYEGDETVFLDLSNVINALISDNQAQVLIQENESFPGISVADVTVDESATTASLSVNLSPPSAQTITVNYATANGSAQSSLDYTSNAGQITFNPGQVNKIVSVAILEDQIYENDEQFLFDLTLPSNSNLIDDQAVVVITENDPLPTLSVSNVSVLESSGIAFVNVSLDAESSLPVTALYNTANGVSTNGAVAPSDYGAINGGLLTISPGQTSGSVGVNIVNEATIEVDEIFTLTFSSLQGAVSTNLQAIVTIQNDDLPIPPVLTIQNGNGQAILSWSSVSGATNYNAYYATQSGVTPDNYASMAGVAMLDVTTDLIVPNLANGTNYYFVVTSLTSDVESASSNQVAIRPRPNIPIQALLNDSGIVFGAYDGFNDTSCLGISVAEQDCRQGRDHNTFDITDGFAGFSFNKLDANGAELPANATTWQCVKDEVTGLVWEVKQPSGSATYRDASWTYSYFNTSGINDGGDPGVDNDGICFDVNNCDTEKFIKKINQAGLCGFNDWRLPTDNELFSILNLNRSDPAIDINYFPFTRSTAYWTSSVYVDETDVGANTILFSFGAMNRNRFYDEDSDPIDNNYAVRAVRAGN